MHAALDQVAMWLQDRLPRAPAPFHAPERPIACFGPLPALAVEPPHAPGLWWAPSPLPVEGDAALAVDVTLAAGPRRAGTAVLVPPWKLPSRTWLGGWVALLTRAGYDVWTVVPPRHHERTPAGARSGEGFVSPDVRVLQESLEQLVLELRALTALARRRGGQVAMVGLSLGALAAALAATSAEPADRVALVAPPADLATLLLETPVGRRYVALAARAGGPMPDLRAVAALLAGFRPEARAPTARAVLVAVGDDDRIASPAAARRLASAWGITPSRYRRGHLTLLFGCRAVRREVAAFLAAAGGARPG